jgi:hypothetical protein
MRALPSRVRAPVWCFLAILWVVSAFDYADHVTRPEPDFRDHWLGWLAFTVASTLGISAVILGGHLVGPRLGWRRLVIDASAVALAPAVHVWATGPLANRVFYPWSDLHFSSPWGLSAALLAAYVVVRGVCLGIGKVSARSHRTGSA